MYMYIYISIHKPIGELSLKQFLLLSQALSSSFVRVCDPADMYARWRSGLPFKILVALFFSSTLCQLNFFY